MTAVIWTYIMFVITNLVALVGFVAIYNWISTEDNGAYRIKKAALVQTVIGFIFLAFAILDDRSKEFLFTLMGSRIKFVILPLGIVTFLAIMLDHKWQRNLLFVMVAGWFLSSQWSLITLILTAFELILVAFVWYYRDFFGYTALRYFLATFILFIPVQLMTMVVVPDSLMSVTMRITNLLLTTGAVYGYGSIVFRINERVARDKQEALLDGLTGLNNFRAFNFDLQNVFHDFEDNQQTFAVFALDIDHFKAVNDRYGHLAGNEVLKRVATTLQDCTVEINPENKVYRTGGEELIGIVFRNAGSDKAAMVALRTMQCRIAKQVFEFDGDQVSVTVSFGESVVTSDDHNPLDVYKRADKELYTSKRSGRNAVTVRGVTVHAEPI